MKELSERQITWLKRTFSEGTKIQIDTTESQVVPNGSRVIVKEIDLFGILHCDFGGKTVEINPAVDVFHKVL